MGTQVRSLINLWGRSRKPDAAASGSRRGHLPGEVDDVGALLEDVTRARDAGRLADALRHANRALKAAPSQPEVLAARGETLFAWRRVREAHRDLVRAESLGLRGKRLYLHLGWTSFAVAQPALAEAYFRKAIEADDACLDAHLNLACVLREQGKTDEAIASFRRALALDSANFDVLTGLGIALLKRRPDEAEIHLRHAVDFAEDKQLAWGHVGMALALQDRNDEAMRVFTAAANADVEDRAQTERFANLAIHLGDEGRTDEALHWFERGLARHAGIHANLAYAHALLRAGRLDEGWQQYEFRWMTEPGVSRRSTFGVPVWSGQELRGKTILLSVEQGLGDTFQFVRYAPMVKALGATVVMMPGSLLRGIAERFAGVDVLVDTSSPPPLDYHVPLLSLPRVFGTEPETIPKPVPLLPGNPEHRERWAARLGVKRSLRVGLVWAGSPSHERDRYRSLTFEMLLPLLEVPGIEFIALQKGPAADAASLKTLSLGPELDDWRDTAAVIEHLDLLISVDTAIAHLAATIGTPVWMLVPRPPDFRWREVGEETAWYPSMRLFRQEARGDWKPVVERLVASLTSFRSGDSTRRSFAGEAAPSTPAAPMKLARHPDELPRGRPGFAAVAETRHGLLEYLVDREPVASGLRWYGGYLQPQIDLCTSLLAPGEIAAEVAAGCGEHALGLSLALGSGGELFLFERDEALAAMLKNNLQANNVQNATLIRRPLAGLSSGSDSSAPGDTLDDLQLDRLHLLKINDPSLVDPVLSGAAETIWRARPRIVAAIDDLPASSPLVQRLQGFGYRTWRVDTELFNPANFNRRTEDIYEGRVASALVAIPEEHDGAAVAANWIELA